ncbi:hypothetical protein AOC36_03770 [Erysipelothrix larvae]|uniref:Phosphopantetheine adenylyltransferase n=1 Tax=Erysipelothrix larvae TaxID=1514105 RepID=A0A109UGU3_9FIRM|nr:pantetheine-phosphate adenylyltransferase [Erysipelothrix larvae]AMC93121.1 hypothetical protein AOC36_03770 [Erysipelothrix larvae]
MKVMITGSYDPITLGHIDIIKRASKLFDEVYVALLINENKVSLFSLEERVEFVQKVINDLKLDNCKVVSDRGLAVDFAQKLGCSAFVRGVRSSADYEYEVGQASINKMLNEKIETLFLVAAPDLAHISSSMVKAVASFGGDLSQFVPKHVEHALRLKYPVQIKGTKI